MIDRSKDWWLAKAADERETVGARSKLTMELPKLTREQKRYLRKIAKRKPIDWGATIGGRKRRKVIWRPGNFLFAIHEVFTWTPRVTWKPHWRSIWWLWFEASRAEAEQRPATASSGLESDGVEHDDG